MDEVMANFTDITGADHSTAQGLLEVLIRALVLEEQFSRI